MRNTPSQLHRRGRFLAAAVIAVLASAWTPGAADAQTSVVALVNGDPITSYDIDQRTRLAQVSGQGGQSRKAVLDELIDEKLKIQLLKRFNIDGIDNDVDNAIANMARRSRMTSQQFLDQLGRANIAPGTLKARIKAEIVWSQIVRGRYQASFQFNEKEILAKLESNPNAKPAVGYDYSLRPILFIVPRGSNQGVVAGRMREAEALRGRFTDCTSGVRIARTIRDVAVRAPVVRSSADLAPQLRDVLEKTEIGRLSSPEVTQNGIEVYALCGKKPSTVENTPGHRETRNEMISARFQEQSKRFLDELRRQAMIEYR